ncbi:putative kinesin-like protein KIF25 [Apostichopus japonicus]|uniref:Putative kinesin-like protein KIF25 n=1 Tax=Stichopus japonicus TaxID=307972 RepID=A0A2G8JBX7_STIJA|nr:putative kinesin-like protein KIF25 [Apostichopus japonicus]
MMPFCICGEVYNNEIRDLLTFDPAGMKHDVYTSEDGSMEVTSVSTKLIHSVEDLIHFVHHGLTHRHEDSTLVHDHSSRSHLVVTLTVTGIPTPTKMGTNRSGEEIVKTKLQLVDLAGSECVETLQCLGFGSRARQVQRGPVKRRPSYWRPTSGGGSRSPVVTSTRRSHSLTSIHREHSLEVTTPNRLLYSEGNRFGYRGAPP